MSDAVDVLRPALLPLSTPPQAPGWNHAQVQEWLGEAPRIPAAVLLAFREGPQADLLFTRRTDHLLHHAGQVAFPGGRVEPEDDDVVATALRECEEEVGLPPAMVTPLGFLDCFETVSGFCVIPVVARVAADAPPLAPQPDEVAEVFEVPLAFFLDPANLRRYTMEYRGRRRPMVEFQYAGHRIWGATAAMLVNLLERMGRL
jgi:8-oxo-dGTP pyrophosphatase MutT (NUDIX family)